MTRRQVPEMCERLLANPLIEDYEVVELEDVAGVRFGVLRFPGSCDEIDALLACRRFGDAELLWHGDRDLGGVDAVVVPGGFSYGDYLRAGAIARFSPADGGGDRLRARRRARARHLQRVPGAVRGRAAARGAAAERARCASSAAKWTSRSSTPTLPSRARAEGATCCRCPSSTRPGATTRRGIDGRGDAGRPALRAGPEPERRPARHRRRLQHGRATCSA